MCIHIYTIICFIALWTSAYFTEDRMLPWCKPTEYGTGNNMLRASISTINFPDSHHTKLVVHLRTPRTFRSRTCGPEWGTALKPLCSERSRCDMLWLGSWVATAASMADWRNLTARTSARTQVSNNCWSSLCLSACSNRWNSTNRCWETLSTSANTLLRSCISWLCRSEEKFHNGSNSTSVDTRRMVWVPSRYHEDGIWWVVDDRQSGSWGNSSELAGTSEECPSRHRA